MYHRFSCFNPKDCLYFLFVLKSCMSVNCWECLFLHWMFVIFLMTFGTYVWLHPGTWHLDTMSAHISFLIMLFTVTCCDCHCFDPESPRGLWHSVVKPLNCTWSRWQCVNEFESISVGSSSTSDGDSAVELPEYVTCYMSHLFDCWSLNMWITAQLMQKKNIFFRIVHEYVGRH